MMKGISEPRLLPQGEKAIVVEFGQSIQQDVWQKVQALTVQLENALLPGVVELIPSYRSLLIHFDPLQLDKEQIQDWLSSHMRNLYSVTEKIPVVVIPVVYGGQWGPDLPDVASYAQLTEAEVVRLHSSQEYLIYMMGFTPGFPYLGGLHPQIACPRLGTPRKVVPAGSVGIAGEQTGVYPLTSPGGWRLIGRTPLKLFDSQSGNPFLLRAGLKLRFKPIDEDEYLRVEALVSAGNYRPEVITSQEERPWKS